MRTPLGRVLGLGAAREGSGHWWSQRVTALALVPLTFWVVYSVISLSGMTHASVIDWMQNPYNAVLFVLFLGALFFHSFLGVQVVIQDYVHGGWLKLAALILLQFAYFALAGISIFAVLHVALGGSPA